MSVNIDIVPGLSKDRTINIKGCLSFSVENRGTTMVLLSFDDGNSWLDVEPDSARDMPVCFGQQYEGEMRVKFGDVVTKEGETPPPATNKVNVIKQLFKCE